MSQKTFTPKIQTKTDRKWYLLDVKDMVVGKVATKAANILRGKNKAVFTPHLDMGDYLIIVNAEQIRLTGKKEDQKEYIHHTGYLGHLRRKPFKVVQQRNPTRILDEAITGMIPRNRLRTHILRKLFLYAGSEHPHAGQNPISINL